ncbi:methyltransferase family protein [Edaphobacter dinghuensis]|uniref:Protein-S-isoprenylcysteine methyltransferase n=1 Tax=Edaphobacter dinghuensis TaxID=1560005 RepID=A0A917M5J0_9BACT|nr:isoprenylcysteine carboxylmethyltransferase family protein [Edaphobacter dinghuensis]GGG80396.1 protein-S-isoprenylcysteine methyltransferase [Edaphobacter dinghuensis]
MDLSMLWTVLSWAWIASEVGILLLTRTSRSTGEVQDRGSILILWGALLSAISLGRWFGESHARTMFHDAHWLRPASVVIFAVALALRWTAVITLGRSFSANVAIRATQSLHTTGLYRIVRHPSYTGLIFIFFAEALRTRNWVGFAIVMVPTTAALIYRIRVEEAALRSAFGEEYAAYSRRTKRLIPGLY